MFKLQLVTVTVWDLIEFSHIKGHEKLGVLRVTLETTRALVPKKIDFVIPSTATYHSLLSEKVPLCLIGKKISIIAV